VAGPATVNELSANRVLKTGAMELLNSQARFRIDKEQVVREGSREINLYRYVPDMYLEW